MNKEIENIVSVLTADEQQLLKDTINYGGWGDGEMEFLDAAGNEETSSMYGYCTNDAKQGGHFKGRKVSAMFRSMYNKLCASKNHTESFQTSLMSLITAMTGASTSTLQWFPRQNRRSLQSTIQMGSRLSHRGSPDFF